MARQKKPLGTLDKAARLILHAAYLDSGMSQAEIAKKSGLSQNRVSIVLRGDTPPASIGELDAIASALGLNTAEVIREAIRKSRQNLSVTSDSLQGPDEWALAADTSEEEPDQ